MTYNNVIPCRSESSNFRGRIVVTGDYHHSDFSVINDSPACFEFQSINQLAVAKGPSPELIVVAQARRGQISQAEINRLRELCPLAPIVVVLGSWCEGQSRSGRPLEGVHHIYWHKWLAEFEKFCRQTASSGTSDWHQPATVSRADRLADVETVTMQGRQIEGLAIVSCPRRSGFELVSDVCLSIGVKVSWFETNQSIANVVPRVLIINTDFGTEHVCETARTLRSQFGELPVIVVSGFPRMHDVDLLKHQITKCSIVSKPLDNAELEHAIRDSLNISTVRRDALPRQLA